jgi:hypothetical protein
LTATRASRAASPTAPPLPQAPIEPLREERRGPVQDAVLIGGHDGDATGHEGRGNAAVEVGVTALADLTRVQKDKADAPAAKYFLG